MTHFIDSIVLVSSHLKHCYSILLRLISIRDFGVEAERKVIVIETSVVSDFVIGKYLYFRERFKADSKSTRVL